MNVRRLSRAGIALIAALALAPAALAQVARGNIYGKVSDEQGAVLPGATVTLTGAFGTRTTSSDVSGGFRILNVDQGTHTLSVSLASFATVKRQVVVRTGENPTIDFALKLAGVQESVEVTAETPVVDPKRVGTSTIITKDELASIPTSRDPWALMRTIPGVTVDRVNVAGSESGQQSQFSAKGADPKDSVWAIDGVVITDMSAIGSSPDYFTYDSFDEVNFSTAGSGVTVATGGLGINLAPKRGTNQFHGTANGYFTHNELQWSNLPAELVGDPRLQGSDKADHTDQIFDWSADLGGPIVKDKLWFYGSVGENDIRIRRLTQSQDKTRLTTSNAKLNWQPSPNDMVSLFWFQGGKEKIGRTGAAGSLVHLEGTLWDQGKAWPGSPHGLTKLEWNHTFGPSFFVDLKGSTYNTGFDLVPQGGLETSKWVIDNVNAEGRGTGYAQYYERPQKTVTADASYFATALGGTHEIKFGGGWRDVKSSSQRVNPGDKIQARYNPTSTRARFYRDSFSETEGVYWHGYASDAFTRGRLTLDLGLRFDHQTSQKNPSQVAGNPLVPGGLLPDINFPGDSEPPITWDTLSPRLGATLALDEGRKTLARVSLALYRGQLGNFEAGWTNPIRTSYVEYDWRDANGDQVVQTPEVDFSRIRTFSNVNLADPTALESTFSFDPGFHANKDYQAVVGLDRELRPNLAASDRVHLPQVDRSDGDAAAVGLLLVRVGGHPALGLPGRRELLRERLLHDAARAERRRARPRRRDRRRRADEPQGLQPHLQRPRALAREAAVEQVDGPCRVQLERLARAPRPRLQHRRRGRDGQPQPHLLRLADGRGRRRLVRCRLGQGVLQQREVDPQREPALPAAGRVRGGREPVRAAGLPEPDLRAGRPRRARRHVPRARRRHQHGHATPAEPVGPRPAAREERQAARLRAPPAVGGDVQRVQLEHRADARQRLQRRRVRTARRDPRAAHRALRRAAARSRRRAMGRARPRRPGRPRGASLPGARPPLPCRAVVAGVADVAWRRRAASCSGSSSPPGTRGAPPCGARRG